MPQAVTATNDTAALFKMLFGEESDADPKAVEKPICCRKRHRGKTTCPFHAPASSSTDRWQGDGMEDFGNDKQNAIMLNEFAAPQIGSMCLWRYPFP